MTCISVAVCAARSDAHGQHAVKQFEPFETFLTTRKRLSGRKIPAPPQSCNNMFPGMKLNHPENSSDPMHVNFI